MAPGLSSAKGPAWRVGRGRFGGSVDLLRTFGSSPLKSQFGQFAGGLSARRVGVVRSLRDLRVLVVEDEFLVALDVAATLRDAGCEVVEICTSEEAAERSIAQQALDAAVLDVSLRGKMAFAIADRLAEADVPFIWVSGYSREVLPEQHRQRPLVGKPFQSGTLVAELEKAATSSRF